MALGIPVIAANRGMLPEIVTHGHDGLIVEDTPEALAGAIMQLVEQPELRRQMAANALQTARTHFDLEVQTKKIEAIYAQVLSGRRPAG
jgi:glycosyltransferase involved in cell wall biosynthesis